MPFTTCASDSVPLPCYFTYSPPVYDHFSAETPSASPIHSPGVPDCNPHHPLLAYRPPQATTTNSRVSNDFFRMQTAAAHHQSPIRPSPVPQQNLLHVTSDDSITSSSSSSSTSSASSSRSSLEMFSTLELARCSRCQRTPSTDIRTGKSNMVQYGLNLWYCSRCANLVGLIQR